MVTEFSKLTKIKSDIMIQSKKSQNMMDET